MVVKFALFVLVASPVLAAPPRPVCADGDVLDFMARVVRDRDPYAVIDPRTVTELPASADTNDKLCAAGVASVLYHQPPYAAPVPMRDVARYEVRVLPDGYVVDPSR